MQAVEDSHPLHSCHTESSQRAYVLQVRKYVTYVSYVTYGRHLRGYEGPERPSQCPVWDILMATGLFHMQRLINLQIRGFLLDLERRYNI